MVPARNMAQENALDPFSPVHSRPDRPERPRRRCGTENRSPIFLTAGRTTISIVALTLLHLPTLGIRTSFQ
jgi:hypothetical protein